MDAKFAQQKSGVPVQKTMQIMDAKFAQQKSEILREAAMMDGILLRPQIPAAL